MRDIKNNTTKSMEFEEYDAILKCGKILSDAFKKKIFVVTINPNAVNSDDVYGVAFSFDLNSIDGYKNKIGQG